MQELILICGTVVICTLIVSRTIKEIEQYKTYMEYEGLIDKLKEISSNIKTDVIIDSKTISEKN